MYIGIQENSGDLSANPEKVGTAGHPGLAYAFDRIPGKKQSYNHANGNRDARKLFTDNTYVAAHRGKSGATRVLQNGVDPAWAGASVDTVSIPHHVARCIAPAYRLGELPRDPLSSRMGGNRQPEQLPTGVLQDQQSIQQPKRDRRHQEQSTEAMPSA